MAPQQQPDDILTRMNKALGYHQRKDFYSREEWGSYDFKDVEENLNPVITLLTSLMNHPLEPLPNSIIDRMDSLLNEFIRVLEDIDQFNIQDPNASRTRERLAAVACERAEALYTHVATWLPFLAHQVAGIDQHIQQITESEQKAKDILAAAETVHKEKTEEFNVKKEEIDSIMTVVREQAVAAGTGVFTEDFQEEADKLTSNGIKWLKTTGLFAFATVCTAIVFAFCFQPPPDVDTGGMLQRVGSKIVLLGILFGTTIWCGRIYRSQMHQAATNKHRALSIQTVQAFHRSAADPTIKDAVVLEAARAIYANVPIGLVDDGQQDQSSRIIEVTKAIVPKSTPT